MINILEWEVAYIKQWLATRHLYLLRFVEDEIENRTPAADSDSEVGMQSSSALKHDENL